MSAPVRVEGLRELRRELRAVEGQWPKELQRTNKEVAERVVLPAVQRRAASQPRVRGDRPRPERQHWRDYVASYRALATQTRAQVAAGSARVPWALGQNFGSISSAKRQFPPQADPDHALYRGIAETTGAVVDTYGDMIEQLTRRAFPD